MNDITKFICSGAGLIYFSNEVKEVSYDYTECFSAETPDVLCADKLETNPSKTIVTIIEKFI